jgi:micrococcal nuclease
MTTATSTDEDHEAAGGFMALRDEVWGVVETVCIPPRPPDLDCGEISYRRFQVLSPDPHGFDGDNDGVGCESG